MKQIIVMILAVLALSACSSTERGAAVGAGAGAVIGGVTTNSVAGAAVGAAVGGVAGAVIGKVAGSDDMCYYRDRYGRTYKDTCPRG